MAFASKKWVTELLNKCFNKMNSGYTSEPTIISYYKQSNGVKIPIYSVLKYYRAGTAINTSKTLTTLTNLGITGDLLAIEGISESVNTSNKRRMIIKNDGTGSAGCGVWIPQDGNSITEQHPAAIENSAKLYIRFIYTKTKITF